MYVGSDFFTPTSRTVYVLACICYYSYIFVYILSVIFFKYPSLSLLVTGAWNSSFSRSALAYCLQVERLGHSAHPSGDVQLPHAPHSASLQGAAPQPSPHAGCSCTNQPEPAPSVVSATDCPSSGLVRLCFQVGDLIPHPLFFLICCKITILFLRYYNSNTVVESKFLIEVVFKYTSSHG